MTDPQTLADRLGSALERDDPSARLRAALAAGAEPLPEYAAVLVARCAVEPDFFVRDMLTWALTRVPSSSAVPLLLDEVRSGLAQARSQALHTLSKIRDRAAWSAITPELLLDPDDAVARSAWRAAVVLVPEGSEPGLATVLVSQLGRGDGEVRRSLSRALVDLGDAAEEPLAHAAEHADAEVRAHAIATQRLVLDPESGFDDALHEARRIAALGVDSA